MAATYSTALKTARMNAIVTALGTAGKLKFKTSGGTLLATFTLANPAGTVSGDTLTFSDANGATAGILNTTAVADGTVALADLTDSSDTVVVSGLTVGTSGTDFTIDNAALTNGQNVTVTSASIQHAA